ncbi:MAG: orotidine-5'-phosphate decarboxylase [Candidatus Omnitrophica bacterium]|nr:orotidine-5'-phosphate decarboxylase [Candidatus Omnitrophota bacterium]
MGDLAWQRLIVALDCEDKIKIKRILAALCPKVKKFKIGLISYVRFGPSLIKMVKNSGADVFLDLKFFDIPNTMEKAAFSAAELGAWALTVHIKAGIDSLCRLKKALADFCRKKKLKRPLILGVSELTSESCSKDKVLRLAGLASKAKLDGIICSPKEAPFIKKKYKNLKIITPGIRSNQDLKQDQKRTSSAKEALKAADYIVVGRPIIGKRDCLKAAKEILSY